MDPMIHAMFFRNLVIRGYHRIGLWENLQESPIFDAKNPWVSCKFSLFHQSSEGIIQFSGHLWIDPVEPCFSPCGAEVWSTITTLGSPSVSTVLAASGAPRQFFATVPSLGVGVSELEFQMCKKDQVHQPSLTSMISMSPSHIATG